MSRAKYQWGATEYLLSFAPYESRVFCKICTFKYLWRLGHKDEESQEIGTAK